MKHKTEDFKLSAINYNNNNDVGYDTTCNIFGCKKSSLKRWIQYKTIKNILRKNKNAISYKVKKEQVKTALNILDTHEQFTMSELLIMMKEKYKNTKIQKYKRNNIELRDDIFIIHDDPVKPRIFNYRNRNSTTKYRCSLQNPPYCDSKNH